MSIGERLRERRRNIHMSQEYLAEAVDVHANTIRKWEKGQRSPRAEELAKLASALNTTVAYLTGETDEPERIAPMEEPEPAPVKVETQTQTRDRGELYYRFADGSEIRLPDTPENKVLFREMVAEGLRAGKGE